MQGIDTVVQVFFFIIYFTYIIFYIQRIFFKPGMDIYKLCLIWLIFICVSLAYTFLIHLCCEIFPLISSEIVHGHSLYGGFFQVFYDLSNITTDKVVELVKKTPTTRWLCRDPWCHFRLCRDQCNWSACSSTAVWCVWNQYITTGIQTNDL